MSGNAFTRKALSPQTLLEMQVGAEASRVWGLKEKLRNLIETKQVVETWDESDHLGRYPRYWVRGNEILDDPTVDNGPFPSETFMARLFFALEYAPHADR